MQLSARDSESIDYQQLYRKHVHENMMLHKKLKSMDDVERNKIKELQNNAIVFKGKYLKYLQKNKGAMDNSMKWRKQGKNYKHRSAYLVCKNFAYPAKAWHDLVDVSRCSLDVYKSEILKNTIGERPENKQQSAQTCTQRRPVANKGAPVTPRNIFKTNRNAYTKYDKNNNTVNEALPCLVLTNDSNQQTSPIVIIEDTEHCPEVCSARRPGEARLPRISRLSVESAEGASTPTDFTDSDAEPRYSEPYRRRSQTISTTINHQTPDRDGEFPRLNSFHSLTEVRRSFSLLEENSPQVLRLGRSFENLKHCRYLRSADDKSLNEGLDSLTYSREKLDELV